MCQSCGMAWIAAAYDMVGRDEVAGEGVLCNAAVNALVRLGGGRFGGCSGFNGGRLGGSKGGRDGQANQLTSYRFDELAAVDNLLFWHKDTQRHLARDSGRSQRRHVDGRVDLFGQCTGFDLRAIQGTARR